jgi:Fic family protein
MQPTEFKEDMPGRLIRIPEGTWAFVPAPIPRDLQLDIETTKLLEDATLTLGTLGGIGRRLPNPHLLIGPFLRREAVLSSRIEGTIASLQQLVLFEAAPSEKPEAPDAQEVLNYVHATQHGLKRLKELPVCLRLIRELHKELLSGVRGQEWRPGEFRDGQNYIGKRDRPISEARFVPPPVSEMTLALDDLEKFLNNPPHNMPGLIQLALTHYQFEAIHPFKDGNGRIGRLLITLLLCEKNLLPKPLLYLSAFFAKNRDSYDDCLLRISQEGAWLDWCKFFLAGIAEQSEDAVKRADKLFWVWEDYHRRLQSARSSSLPLKLVDNLFHWPAISVPRVREILEVSPRTAYLTVGKLIKEKILVEATGKRRGRVFLAPEIIEIVEADLP